MNIIFNDNDSGPWGNNGGGNNQIPWGKDLKTRLTLPM